MEILKNSYGRRIATTVRGYSEGLLIVRSRYLASGELMFPLAPRIRIDKKQIKQKTLYVTIFVKFICKINFLFINFSRLKII